jgi:hypothetical protein
VSPKYSSDNETVKGMEFLPFKTIFKFNFQINILTPFILTTGPFQRKM